MGRFSTTNLCWEGIELGEVGKLCTVRKVQKEMGQVWTPNVSQDYHDGYGVGADDGGGDGGADGGAGGHDGGADDGVGDGVADTCLQAPGAPPW